MKITPSDSNDFYGIIHKIRDLYYHQFYKYVDVTSSSVYSTGKPWSVPRCLLNYDVETVDYSNNWCSENEPKSNFTIYFYQFQLYITHYAFQSRNIDPQNMPKTWELYGSNDNISWIFIDNIENIDNFLEASSIHNFEVKNPGKYRYFRFIQTGLNSDNKNLFCLHRAELFGLTIQTIITCQHNIHIDFSLILIFFIILQ